MRPLATILLLTLCGCGHLTKVEAQDSGTYSCLLTDSGCVELPKPVTGHVNRVQLDHASMPPFDMAPKEWDETVMSCCPAIMRGGLCEMYPEGGCPDNSKGPWSAPSQNQSTLCCQPLMANFIASPSAKEPFDDR
jgi:hypothetical protein